MILGIGTDIARIDRIASMLADHGARFIERCYAREEREKIELLQPERCAAAYAKRWAAKEACAKALGLGIRDNIYLKDIVVVNDAAGKPGLVLNGGAADRLKAITPAGYIARLDISLSDEELIAVAFVVISAEKE